MRRGLYQPLAFLIAACLLACTGGESTDGEVGPVILIGIDGGSWNAIHTLMERNELPNFRAMMERGVTAELKPVAAASPVIWTSMATGVRPERHGITNFVVPTSTKRRIICWSDAHESGTRWVTSLRSGRRVANTFCSTSGTGPNAYGIRTP